MKVRGGSRIHDATLSGRCRRPPVCAGGRFAGAEGIINGIEFYKTEIDEVMQMWDHVMNALLLGETEAGHLGVNVERTKQTIIVLTALGVGASVSAAGVIGFVGLVVPHLLRLVIGPDHRNLLPCSALLGASLLLGADLVSRTLVAPAELPIGIVTAMLGAPFFLWLLLRNRGGSEVGCDRQSSNPD